jgi:DNA-binding transcriptional regulator YdaS (Cro superfamily)
MSEVVSKSRFAEIIGVSPGRVSQYISEGKISRSALVGEGQRAKINVEVAKADLRRTLDIAQRLGNGISTRIDAAVRPDEAAAKPAGEAGASAAPLPEPPRGIDQELKLEKLQQIRRANRNAAIADAQSRGELITTVDAKAEMTKVAQAMMQEFEGEITDFATAIAARFSLPQRDVIHLLRQRHREFRAERSSALERAAAAMPETVETQVLAHDDEEELA